MGVEDGAVATSQIERPTTPCVLWRGPLDGDGYGKHGSRKAHRVAWVAANGPIPKGYEIDHTCEVRACVRLDHLDVVTHAENIRRMVQRGNHWKQKVTHCPAGHAYDEHGVVWGGKRYCRLCRKENQLRSRGRGSVKLVCAIYGGTFRVVPSRTRAKFCSPACKAAGQVRRPA